MIKVTRDDKIGYVPAHKVEMAYVSPSRTSSGSIVGYTVSVSTPIGDWWVADNDNRAVIFEDKVAALRYALQIIAEVEDAVLER